MDYHILKDKVDPKDIIEDELAEAWTLAEKQEFNNFEMFSRPVAAAQYDIPKSSRPPHHMKPLFLISVLCLGLLAISKG